MKVSILQVDRCKPILGLDAFEDWSTATAFFGHDEVGAVKLLPHLGWRDRLDCILCQEDSNLIAQDSCVSDCHRRLNRIAESNCANEPARRAGWHKPRPQLPCKWHQRNNRCTRTGAANGSKAGWYRRSCVLTSSQNSLSPCRVWLEARGEALHPPIALSWPLARWVAGKSEEAVRCTLSAREPENSEEREIALSLTMSLLQGKERRCPRHLLRWSSFPHLRVARVRAALSPPWTISGPAGTRGAPRSCEPA